MTRLLIRTDQTCTHDGCTFPLYRVPDQTRVSDVLHAAAGARECFGACGKMSEALEYLAEMFDVNGDGGEPWSEDDQGRALFDLSDFMVAVIKEAQKVAEAVWEREAKEAVAYVGGARRR